MFLNVGKLIAQTYGAKVDGSVGKGRPRYTFLDPIVNVLKKSMVKSTKLTGKRLMRVEEEKEVFQKRSGWDTSVIVDMYVHY